MCTLQEVVYTQPRDPVGINSRPRLCRHLGAVHQEAHAIATDLDRPRELGLESRPEPAMLGIRFGRST